MAKIVDKMFNRVIEGDLKDLSVKDGEEIAKVVSGGTKLYKHTIVFDDGAEPKCIVFLSNSNSTSTDELTWLPLANSGIGLCYAYGEDEDYETDFMGKFITIALTMEDNNEVYLISYASPINGDDVDNLIKDSLAISHSCVGY